MADQGAKLTPLGKIFSIALILALLAGGAYIVISKFTGGGGPKAGPVATTPPAVEAVDPAGVTTVREYKYIPAERLPAVKGVSKYKWDDKNKVLRFSYNVWSGWLPVIAANRGTKAYPDRVFA